MQNFFFFLIFFARDASHSLVASFENKLRKHGDACKRRNVVFIPLPVQTLGSWHLEAAFELRRIGLALAKRSSGDEKVVVTHFFQRLAVFLQRGNAHLILSRQPTFPERHVGRRLTSLVVFVFVLFRILFNRN